jgi:hypothetical protein
VRGCPASLAAIRHGRAGTAVLRLEPGAAAAFNGLIQRHPYGAITGSGNPGGTDHVTVNAAIESLRPAVSALETGRVVTARLRATPASRADHLDVTLRCAASAETCQSASTAS